jgi:glutathione synthase/RimK-type ligase-like ATP-grasp enzyme
LRFDTDGSLPGTRLSYEGGTPVLEVDGIQYEPNRFTNVWYRRPERFRSELLDDTPEGRFVYGEWVEALEGFFGHIDQDRWINHPSRNVAASHKIEQLTTARALGFRIPDTLVTQDAGKLRAFFSKHDGKIIVKPMVSRYVERPDGQMKSLVYTNKVDASHLEKLDDLPASPTLFQQRIDKSRDVRITVVGEHIHAVALTAREPDGSQRCDIRRNNMEDVEYQEIACPAEVARGVKTLMGRYGLRFAAIDMAIGADGLWYFFEVNPNGQWAWLDLAGGMDIASSFVMVFRD